MKILLQKVSEASVSVDGSVIGQIGKGYLLFLGVMKGDSEKEATELAEKIIKLRLFEGDDRKINDKTILDIGGEVLVISQFTLAGNLEGQNRPDYTEAAEKEIAEKLYDFFIESLKKSGIVKVEKGEFGARMEVTLTNDGPVTLLIERKPSNT